jgi:hypothetical protein
MSRKGRGDKKALEIARTETFGRGNLGSHCLRLVELIWVAGFDGSCPSFIREKFSPIASAALFPSLAMLIVALANVLGVGALRRPDIAARCPYRREISSTISPFGGWAW